MANKNTRELEYHGATVGAKQSKLYQVWSQIKQRCYNKNNKKYPEYGAKGIDMDPRWRESFMTFSADVKKLPGASKGRALGRKDIKKGYWPNNVIWQDHNGLMRNTSTNHVVTFQGKKMTLAEVSEITGIDPRRLQDRVAYQGMNIELAVELPIEHGIDFYTYKGEVHKLSVWAKRIGKPYGILYGRIKKLNWPIEKAFEVPV